MILHITKKLGEWLGLGKLPMNSGDFENLYSWRANLVQEDGFEFIVFVNEASRYVVFVNKPNRNLPDMLIETLRGAMLADNVNPNVIDRYIKECGEVRFVRNLGRKETAWLNKATDNAWYATRNSEESIAVSQATSAVLVPLYTGLEVSEHYRPKDRFYSMLESYGLPIRSGRAYDLRVRLDLDGNYASRKLRVSANITFEQLHRILQKAFGWKNSHLHSFGMFKEWSKNYYATPDVELVLSEEDFENNPKAKLSANVKLSEYLPQFAKILYRYDYGDDWHHYIELENVIDDCKDELPVLISGEGNAPPEDVGGASGFAEFLKSIGDSNDTEHEFNKNWAKRQFWKPFDFESATRDVSRSLD